MPVEKDKVNPHKIAVLITSFNRLEITKKCIDSLSTFNYNFDIYLVDDGSTDGTFEFISKNYPKINLIKGDGNLFWNRGMNLAWAEALKNNYDYYLWLNDDVFLENYAFDEIFEASEINNNKAIISGIVQTQNNKIIYGGSDKSKTIIKSNGKCQSIKFLNGNFVLVPKFVFENLGVLDNTFHHDLGDVDYGLRARKNKIKVLTTKKAIATGEENNICRIRKSQTSIFNRFKYLNSPLGSPITIIYYFQKKHFGLFKAIAVASFVVFLNLIPDNLNKILFKDKYT